MLGRLVLLIALALGVFAACAGDETATPAASIEATSRADSTATATVTVAAASTSSAAAETSDPEGEPTREPGNESFVATVTAAASGLRQPTSTEMPATPTSPPAPTPTASPASTAPPPADTDTAEPNTEPIVIVAVNGAAPSNEASLTIAVAPGSVCTLRYTTPSGTKSEAVGLGSKTADADGRITWSWMIGGRTKPGNGTLDIDCEEDSLSAPITIG